MISTHHLDQSALTLLTIVLRKKTVVDHHLHITSCLSLFTNVPQIQLYLTEKSVGHYFVQQMNQSVLTLTTVLRQKQLLISTSRNKRSYLYVLILPKRCFQIVKLSQYICNQKQLVIHYGYQFLHLYYTINSFLLTP